MNDVPLREPAPTERVDRIVKAGLVLLVFTVPLVFTTLSDKVATPPKIAWAQTIILFLSLLWLVRMNLQRRFVFHTTHLFWALIIYLGAQALSLTRATNLGYGLFEFRVFLFWFLAYLLVTHHVKERDVPKILGAIVIAGAIASVYGILQHFGKELPWVDWGLGNVSVDTMTLSERARFDKTVEALAQGPSTFGHNNFAAHFLIIAIPLACAMTLTAKTWKTRVLYAVPLALMLWHLNITACRGAVIGLGIGIFVCTCLAVKRAVDLSRSGQLKRVSVKLLLVIALVIVLCIACIGAVLLVTGKGVGIVDQFRRGIDTPYVTRTSIWQSAFRAFLDAPALGVGKGNFEIATPPYWTEQAKAVFVHHLEMGIQAHNEYLEIAVETGVVGFGAFIWLLMCLGSRSLSLWRKDLTRQQRTILMSIMCGMTAVLVHSLVSFNLQTPASALSFFTLVGVIDVFGLEHEPRSVAIPLRGRSLPVVRRAVWILLLCMIPAWWFFTVRPFKARLRIMSGSMAMSRGDAEEAARLFASAAQLTPWNWHVLYRLGNAYSAGNEHEKAIEQYEASLRANPNYVLSRANIGHAYFNSGDPEKAMESARRALSLVPEFPMAHNVVGLCYMKQERWEEALEEFKASTSLPKTGRRQLHRNMGYCYYKLGQLPEAVTEFERAIEASAAASPELHVEKGGVLLEMKEYEKAVESLATGVNLFNANKVSLASSQIMQRGCRQLARLYLERFKNPYYSSRVLVDLSRSVPRDPRTRALTDALFAYLAERGFSFEGAVAAWYHVGGAYLHQRRNDEAEKALTLLIKSGESNVSILQLAYHDLALVIARKGDYDRAIETIDKGKTIAPDFAPLDDLRKRIVAEKESKGQPDQP